MGNVIGYARVSTIDQNLDSQLDALKKAGAARIFTDKLSGSTTARPQLQACLAYLNPGDVLAVYSTDRLGRSVGDLIEIVGRLREQGIQFKSLTEPFDTTDHGGELFFHIVAAFAQMQRRQISEKTRRPRGRESARSARGPADGDGTRQGRPGQANAGRGEECGPRGSRSTTSRRC